MSAPPLPAWITKDYPFARKIVTVKGRQMHVVDEPACRLTASKSFAQAGDGAGRGEGLAVLMVHGNPTWSYLWRKVMASLRGKGLRLVAPDLFGFGLSHKPRLHEHSLAFHVESVAALIEQLGLTRLIVVGQDWGGPIATGAALKKAEAVAGLVYANTAVLYPRRFRTTPFHRLSRLPIISDLLFRGLGFPLAVLHRVQGDPRSIGSEVRRAYWYPLRQLSERDGPLALARMVPWHEKHPSLPVLKQTDAFVRSYEGPSALVWGMRDPILGRALRRMREALPGAWVVETQAGHFLQEEVPQAISDAIERVAASSGWTARRV